MTDHAVLEWEDGMGWLVLSGGPDFLSDIRAQALSRMSAEGGLVAYIGLDDDDYDDIIEDMGELGAPTGYLVNIRTEDDATIHERLSEATLILIPGVYGPEDLRSALSGAALAGMQSAYERGAVILAEGTSAALFGTKFIRQDGTAGDGFAWVREAFIVPAISSIAESGTARMVLSTQVARVAVGVDVGAALVLGPVQQVETWGRGDVTIALGPEPEA